MQQVRGFLYIDWQSSIPGGEINYLNSNRITSKLCTACRKTESRL